MNIELNEVDSKVHDWRLASNTTLLYSQYQSLTDLEEDFDDFNNMDLTKRNISDDKSIELFGKTNKERYDDLLHKMYSRPDEIYSEIRPASHESVDISPLEKLFLLRESAVNRDYIDSVNKSKFTKFIQEDTTMYDINHERELIKDEILTKLNNDNIYNDVGITFPFLSLESMIAIEGSLEPYDDDQERWQKAYKKMMVTGDSKDYMALASYWKSSINDIYNSRLEAEKHGDTDSVKIYDKILVNYGWAPSIDPNNTAIDKASELTRNKIENLLNKITMIDLTTEDEDPQEHRKVTSIEPYIYIAAFKQGSSYSSILLSSDKDFKDAVEVGYDFSAPHTLATPKAIKRSISSFSPNFKCEIYVLFNNGESSKNIISRIYLSNSPDFDSMSEYSMDITNIGGLKLFLYSILSRYGCVVDNDYMFMYKIHDGTIGDYMEDYSEKNIQLISRLKMKYDRIGLTESTTNEFPIEFDKDGNLLINKGSNIDFDGEYSRTHLALKMYEESNNITGMKYCVCKLWYLNIILEDKIHDKKTDVKTKESCMRSRAKIMNDIKKYTPIILKHDPHFDILKTYQNSPFNNDKVVIKSSTLFYIYKLIKRNFTFKELKSIFK